MEGGHGGIVILSFKKDNLLDLPEHNYCGTPKRQLASMVEEESENDVYRNISQVGRVWARIKKLCPSLRLQSKSQIERWYLNTKLPPKFCVYMYSIRNV